MAAAYPTLDNLKSFLDVPGSGDDGVLGWANDAAKEWFLNNTERVFLDPGVDAEVSFPVVRPYVRKRTLWLGGLDLQSVTTLTNGDEQVIPATAYRLSSPTGPPYHEIVLRSEAGVSWSASSGLDIVVDGRWAASLVVPDDVFQAMLLLGQYFHLIALSGPAGSGASRMGEIKFDDADIPGVVRDVARSYRDI